MTAMRLSDLIIDDGPFTEDRPPAWSERLLRYNDVNALRDELIELRAIASGVREQAPCPAGASCWALDR